MAVGVPQGGLRIWIGPDGKPTGRLKLHIHYDVCPTWLELALRHLAEASRCKVARIAAWQTDDGDAKAETLEREFEAAMQAIMAAAIAIDAFYANIKDKAVISASLIEVWRQSKTARYKQISEVIRQAFTLRPEGVKALRQNLRELFKFRDLAIHPQGNIQAPVLHPELNVGVEWRFATFRTENAEALVNETVRMIETLAERGKPKNDEVKRYASGLSDRLQSLRMPSIMPLGDGHS